ncbi:wnt inhibitory factor 1-like [Corticium candelabrum]|uniref:wnt inhibitory factor 1-like n=1 Tax=Corticium candelabrum TaxID=121492 RepID=UPI002E273C01|nr:wnt inhibitory factor 1-like [Corticium candelabrum]
MWILGWDRCTCYRYRGESRYRFNVYRFCCPNYYGTDCDKPYCFGAEDCKNGDCVRPDVCNCNPDYTGMKCLQPVCTKSCLNGGTCTKPDNALVEKTGPALTALSQHVYQ